MKIYTRTGDDGTTALFGGDRVHKDDLRVEAYGTLDELNSFLGYLIDLMTDDRSITFNQKVQHILFNIGSIVATVDQKMLPKLPALLPSDIRAIEEEIDYMNHQLPVMSHFILPGGHPQVSWAHICRTVCRRAERKLVSIYRAEDGIENPLKIALELLNRLSDYFFTLARYLTQLNDKNEVRWKKETTLS